MIDLNTLRQGVGQQVCEGGQLKITYQSGVPDDAVEKKENIVCLKGLRKVSAKINKI